MLLAPSSYLSALSFQFTALDVIGGVRDKLLNVIRLLFASYLGIGITHILFPKYFVFIFTLKQVLPGLSLLYTTYTFVFHKRGNNTLFKQ